MAANSRFSMTVAALVAVFGFAPHAAAHVAITSPQSGAVLTGGSNVQLVWYDSIPHNTAAYDIDFLPAVGAEPVLIAHDVPPTTKEYTWTVPEVSCSDCFVRVLQRNIAYESFDHTLPIVIESAVPMMVEETPPLDTNEEAPAPEASTGCALASAAHQRSKGATWPTLLAVLGAFLIRRARLLLDFAA